MTIPKSTSTFTIYLVALVLSFVNCTKDDPHPLYTKQLQHTRARSNQNGYKDLYQPRFGQPRVTLREDAHGLHVTITTKRLQITSVTKNEVEDYQDHLFGVAKVMEKFATGQGKDRAHTEKRINGWVDRWSKRNPFAGLTIRLKPEGSQAQGEFLGHVVLGGGDEAHSSEIAYMIREDRWNQNYGYEAIGAAVLFYALEMVQCNYKLPNGEPFERIIATARRDNIASAKILNKLGFSVYKQSDKYGHTRDHYELAVKDLE